MAGRPRPYAKAETVVDEYDVENPGTLHKKKSATRKQQSLPSDSGYSSTGNLTSSTSNASRQLPLRTMLPSSSGATVGSESGMYLPRSVTTGPTTGPYQPPPPMQMEQPRNRRAAQPLSIHTNPPHYNSAQPQYQTPYHPPQITPGLPPPSAGLNPPSAGPPSSYNQRMAVPPTSAFSQPPFPQRRRSHSAARPRSVNFPTPPDGYPFSPPANNSPSPHAVPRPTVRVPTSDGGYWERDFDPMVDEAPPVGGRTIQRGNSKRDNRRNSMYVPPTGDYFGAQPQTIEQIQGQYPATRFYNDGDLMPPPPRPSSARPQPRQTIPIHYGPAAQVPAPDPSRMARSASYQTTAGAPVREYASSSQHRLRSDGDVSMSRSRKAEVNMRRAEEHMESNGTRSPQNYTDEMLQQNQTLARRSSRSQRSRTESRAGQSTTESELVRNGTRVSMDGCEMYLEHGRHLSIQALEDGIRTMTVSGPNGPKDYRTESNARSTRASSFAERSDRANYNVPTDSGSSRPRKKSGLPKTNSNGS